MVDKYWDILDKCSKIAKDREKTYGSVIENFKGIQAQYKIITGEDISLSEIINVMIATKLNRRRTSPMHTDNDLDLINYVAIGLYIKNGNSS